MNQTGNVAHAWPTQPVNRLSGTQEHTGAMDCTPIDVVPPAPVNNAQALPALSMDTDPQEGVTIPWLSEGHEWLGRRTARLYGKRTVYGTITKWAAPDKADDALWHVEHDDGDSEDLEEYEVTDVFSTYAISAEPARLAVKAGKDQDKAARLAVKQGETAAKTLAKRAREADRTEKAADREAERALKAVDRATKDAERAEKSAAKKPRRQPEQGELDAAKVLLAKAPATKAKSAYQCFADASRNDAAISKPELSKVEVRPPASR